MIRTDKTVRLRAGLPGLSRPRVTSLLLAAILSLPALAMADEAELRQIVESGALTEHPNSILLDYLLSDGEEALPLDLHEQAVEQIVEALRNRTLVHALEGMNDVMADMNPLRMMGGAKGIAKQMGMGMLRGATGGGGGGSYGGMNQSRQMQSSMQAALIDPWVRGLGAAATLSRAGYTGDATRFYKGCLTSLGSAMPMPMGDQNDWLQDQCIRGALLMGPEAAGALFAELWEEPYMNFGFNPAAFGKELPVSTEIQAVAAHGLGKLVGSDQLTERQRQGVMQELVQMAQTKKVDLVTLTGVVQGLSFAEDPRAVDPLHHLWKKGKPKEIRSVALGGLVAGYRQPQAIKALRKELKTGKGIVATYKKAKSFAPWSSNTQEMQPMTENQGADDAEARYLAARALIRAGDEAGYAFAAKYLDQRNVPKGDWDYRPDLIRDLVETGGEQALSVLDERVTEGHQNEWLEAMMRTGLLEMGDLSQVPELLELIDKHDWDFGRGTAARWYKRFKPLLWQGIKMAAKSYLGMPPDQKDLERTRQIVTNMAWGERDRILARKDERDVKTDQFRWQLADSAGEIDAPESLTLLEPLLEDEEASVRLSAASALLEQSDHEAVDLLLQALQLDYGAEDGVSRNPEIHAAIVRRLVQTFPERSVTGEALALAAGRDSPTVRFLALAASRQLELPPDQGG